MEFKRILAVLGGIASIIGVGCVISLVWAQSDAIAQLNFPLWHVAIYAALYAISLILLAWNWADVVHLHDGSSKAPERQLRIAFLKSQVWKYVPGNIFHFVGRHVAGQMSGASSKALLKGTITETIVLIVAALLQSSIFLFASGSIPFLANGGNTALVITASALLAAAMVTVGILLARNREVIGKLAIVIARASLFMLALGVLASLIAGDATNAPMIIGATSLAWLVGFATPGSPGGIGTREAALIVMLGPVIGEPAVLAVSLILRAATLGGDLLGFLIGAAAERID